MTESVVHTPFPTGTPWLARAVIVSAVLHALAVVVVAVAFAPKEERQVEVVDIEVAPTPTEAEALPAEKAMPVPQGEAEKAATAVKEPEHEEEKHEADVDAGVDAAIDAPVDARPKKPDAAIDAEETPMAAEADAGTADAEAVAAAGADAAAVADAAMVAVAGSGSATGSATGSGSGSEGLPAAVAMGSGSGQPGMTDEPAVDGPETRPGTAANLLAYFPPGHVVSALLRFDRLRGTEWAEPTERVLEPLPDYVALFGAKHAGIADKLDTLVISSPQPRDATATTLVAHTALTRKQMRELLGAAVDRITWSAGRGGMVGRRKPKAVPNDHRVVLSPWKGWFVLAQPDDLAVLVAPTRGNMDTIEAKGKLPPWLDTIRTIEKESGEDKTGPAVIVTLAGDGKRYMLPDVGLGIASLVAPERVSIAIELDPKGWHVRGNIKFATEADAAEFERAVGQAQGKIADSMVLRTVLRGQHLYNAIVGLSVKRASDRVSYATSVSIGDARAVLAALAATLDQYFGRKP